ncbi:MAG: PIN domain-containing protein [Deltaproteobacteria bacterium]|nr:PIN domain-containing protein [Deltaproteobacteria bacterium]MBW2414917.1 PIN domain-containing protein [Deltaproteobacteria bacterium]
MIAIDSSSWVAFFSPDEPEGDDTAMIESALRDHQACLPGVVLAELLSARGLSRAFRELFLELPLLEVHQGFWERAGSLRAGLLSKGRRARLADVLIAQSCIDHGVRLVTRDSDFRHFVKPGGLRLAL